MCWLLKKKQQLIKSYFVIGLTTELRVDDPVFRPTCWP